MQKTPATAKKKKKRRPLRKELPQYGHVSVNEFIYNFGICRKTFYDRMNAGLIRTVMSGSRRMIPVDECVRIQKEGLGT